MLAEETLRAFKDVFRVPPDEMKGVGRLFDEARSDAAGFEPYAAQIAAMFAHEPAVLEDLLAGLFHIAKADGTVRASELEYLRGVARIFGLDAHAFERIRTLHVEPKGADPFDILGVSRGATDAEIKSAYRALIRENHPDTLIAKGLPQEFVDIANEKMAAINAAYDEVERERGLR